MEQADIIFIAVGTPQKSDGHANLEQITDAAKRIALHVKRDAIVVTKSTVPVGTNDLINGLIAEHLAEPISISVASIRNFCVRGRRSLTRFMETGS